MRKLSTSKEVSKWWFERINIIYKHKNVLIVSLSALSDSVCIHFSLQVEETGV